MAAVVVSGVSAAWWVVNRSEPDRVGPRFVQALLDRHPGAAVDRWEAGFLRVVLPSGLYIDVHLATVFERCLARRLDCTSTIDDALAEVDLADRATQAPRREAVRPVVIGEPVAGYRYGFVTDPLIGPLEVRYALVSGVASTFVTNALRDRLHLTPPQLRELAITALAAEPQVDLERIDAGATPIHRVRSAGDPVASLLDAGRMKRFAERIGSTRLYAVVPARGTLYLAAAEPAAGRALAALLARERGLDATAVDAGLLAYDTAAPPLAALSIAARP